MTRLADAALYLARGCGLFALARVLTAGRLRILCYHGVALDDEFEFQPMLFMRAATFADRLDRLMRPATPCCRWARRSTACGRERCRVRRWSSRSTTAGTAR